MKLTQFNQLVEDGQALKGRWELTPNHELRYKSKGKGEEFKFIGSIIQAEPDALVISVTERQADQKIVTGICKLTGAWRLDSKNRIVFDVEKERGRKDSLAFAGTWQVGKAHELIYSYERKNLKTRQKSLQRLVFTGFWDITDERRLAYWLSRDSDSAFRFRGAFQTRSILAKKGEIRYQLGAELKGRHKLQTITLFGKWKLSRNLELSFEIEYEDGRRKAIVFGSEYSFFKDNQVIVNLKSQTGKPLGMELILTAEAGVRFRW